MSVWLQLVFGISARMSDVILVAKNAGEEGCANEVKRG